MAAWWYVDSAASGSHAGTSWINACTSVSQLLALGTPPAAGDSIAIRNSSAETYATTTTLTLAGTLAAPIWIYSCDNTNAPPLATDLIRGASITTTGNSNLTMAGVDYFNGLNIIMATGATGSYAASFNAVSSIAQQQVWDGCSVVCGATGTSTVTFGSGRNSVILNNTILGFVGTASTIQVGGAFYWKNSVPGLTGTAVPTSVITAVPVTGGPTTILIEGVDLSAAAAGKTLTTAINSAVSSVVFKDCKLGASVTITSTPTQPFNDVYNIRCDSAATDYRLEKYSYAGTQTTSTSITRSGGMLVGGTPVSWSVASTTHCSPEFSFISMPLHESNPTTGSAITATLYGVMNSATIPTNAQVWLEVEYLGSSATPLGSYVNSGLATNLTTASNLTVDSTSIWGLQAPARANNTGYTSGTSIIYVADAVNSCRLFFCTQTGTSNSSEPAGYATVTDGNTVTDGTASFIAGMRFSTSVTFTPNMVGDITFRARIGATSFTCYLDPLIICNPQ